MRNDVGDLFLSGTAPSCEPQATLKGLLRVSVPK